MENDKEADAIFEGMIENQVNWFNESVDDFLAKKKFDEEGIRILVTTAFGVGQASGAKHSFDKDVPEAYNKGFKAGRWEVTFNLIKHISDIDLLSEITGYSKDQIEELKVQCKGVY